MGEEEREGGLVGRVLRWWKGLWLMRWGGGGG